ncbi:MAG: hypothetical protein OXR84_05575, partial [Magnetovibrio sp.]|nr:hypothetical protein [Magnetovibrio sp.]
MTLEKAERPGSSFEIHRFVFNFNDLEQEFYPFDPDTCGVLTPNALETDYSIATCFDAVEEMITMNGGEVLNAAIAKKIGRNDFKISNCGIR